MWGSVLQTICNFSRLKITILDLPQGGQSLTLKSPCPSFRNNEIGKMGVIWFFSFFFVRWVILFLERHMKCHIFIPASMWRCLIILVFSYTSLLIHLKIILFNIYAYMNIQWVKIIPPLPPHINTFFHPFHYFRNLSYLRGV